MNFFSPINLSYLYALYNIVQLKKHQWLKEDELRRIQENRLRKIIDHAYENVPFYNNLLKSSNLKPSDIQTIDDLKKIPITSKEQVQKNYPNQIVSKNENLNNCYFLSTSGSTGRPLKICYDYKCRGFRGAVNLFVLFELGLKLSDKLVTIRDDELYDVKESWYNKMGILRKKNVSIFDHQKNILNELLKLKPDVVYTYPSILSLLEKEICKNSHFSFSSKLILTTGEFLSDYTRRKLCDIFGSEILNIYSSIEFGHLAFECKEHSGYHLITDNAIVEFVKDGNDVSAGERGEVIVTTLHNFAMPLIRYKLGDIAVPLDTKCKCGRGFPLIKEIEGREDDFFILPSGKRISPRMINVIEFIPGIQEYKIIQETKERIVVKLVKNHEFSERTIREIQNKISIGCLDEKIEVDIECVEKLPKERTGKKRAVVSKVR
jgi:phenylacetate-CoA ligase